MNLLDILHRSSIPEPWAEGEKIPWNDPDFSRRMLEEHLSQEHDAASRRFDVIDEQVGWIHQHVLKGQSTQILDLGCGPGLYTERLAKLGHRCVGVDFSPASVAYARKQAKSAGLDCQYFQHDIRSADYGADYGLVMSIFGEINVFRPEEAKSILSKAYGALRPDGLLLLEPHTFDAVLALGQQSTAWYSTEHGLFSDQPHFCLQESFWDATCHVAIQRYYVIDAATGEVTCHSSSTQAYTDDEYRSLLTECGFSEVTFCPALGQSTDRFQNNLLVILARKAMS